MVGNIFLPKSLKLSYIIMNATVEQKFNHLTEKLKVVEIVESRDKHWETNICCARCHAEATNCRECRESWERWESGR